MNTELNPNLTPFATTQPFTMPEMNVDRDTPRYLFTAADLVPPGRKEEQSHLQPGGVEMWNPCLRVAGMFVRRGAITPFLLDSMTPIPLEEANTDDPQYFVPPPRGHVEDQGYVGPLQEGGVLLGYPCRPGDQILNILTGPENVDSTGARGLVEIEALKGHVYKPAPCPIPELGMCDLKLWGIQKDLFPDYPIVPVTLKEFRQQLEESHGRLHGVSTARKVAEAAIASCDIAGRWMTRAIEEAHQAMNNAAAKGYVFPYEGIHHVILAQLGMERQDLHYRNVASQAPQQPLDVKGLIELLKAQSDASRAGSREELKAFVSELFEQFRKEDKKKEN